MDEINILTVATACGLVGIAVGALLMYLGGARVQSKQQLEDRAKQAEDKLRNYQAQVTEHFTHTASLVNKLTHSYRDVHDYLAASAVQLGNVDIQPTLVDDRSAPILGTGAVIHPPLDYAPKKDDVTGTLSETYGLRDETTSHQSQPSRPETRTTHA